MNWDAWLHFAWPRLVRGERVEASGLGHPMRAGFRRLSIAEAVGQTEDWALSMTDGSRIHLHGYGQPAERWIAHRDRFDPARGLLSAARHVCTETKTGRAAAVGGLIYGAVRLARGGL